MSTRDKSLVLAALAVIAVLVAVFLSSRQRPETKMEEAALHASASVEYATLAAKFSLAEKAFKDLRDDGCKLEEIDQNSTDAPLEPDCAFYEKNKGAFPYGSNNEADFFGLGALHLPKIGSDKADIVIVHVLQDTPEAESLCNEVNKANKVDYKIDREAPAFASSNAAWEEASLKKKLASTMPGEFDGAREACAYFADAISFGFYHVIEAH